MHDSDTNGAITNDTMGVGPIRQARTVDLAPPPRSVSIRAQLSALFAGTLNQFGWGLLLFSSMFVAIFGLDSEAITRLEFLPSKGTCDGKVTRIATTSASENEDPIMQVDFTYAVDGTSYEGSSYGLHAPFDRGETVKVQYLESRPHRARIEGMRVRRFGFFAVFVFIFPAAALFMVSRGLEQGLRARRLLLRGALGQARLVSKEDTGGSVNNQTIYKLTFELVLPPTQGPGAAYRQQWSDWAKTHRFTIQTHDTARLEDEAMEPALYRPEAPGDAVLVDALPTSLRLHPSGVSGGALRVVVLPLLNFIVYGFATLVILLS